MSYHGSSNTDHRILTGFNPLSYVLHTRPQTPSRSSISSVRITNGLATCIWRRRRTRSIRSATALRLRLQWLPSLSAEWKETLQQEDSFILRGYSFPPQFPPPELPLRVHLRTASQSCRWRRHNPTRTTQVDELEYGYIPKLDIPVTEGMSWLSVSQEDSKEEKQK